MQGKKQLHKVVLWSTRTYTNTHFTAHMYTCMHITYTIIAIILKEDNRMLMLSRKYTILSGCMCDVCACTVYSCGIYMCMPSLCVWYKWLHASKYMEVREGCWVSSSVTFYLIDEIASLVEWEIHHFSWGASEIAVPVSVSQDWDYSRQR